MFIAWSDGNFDRELRLNIDDHVNFVAEEGVIFGLVSPGSVFVRRGRFPGIRVSMNMGRIDGKIDAMNDTDSNCLGDNGPEDFVEGFIAETFSEISKGGMIGSFQVIKTAEITKAAIVG